MTINSVQVTIAKIWPPEGGKKNYNLQDMAGVKYNTFPDDAMKVSPGDMVMLDYEDKEYNGRAFKQTKRLTVVHGATPKPAPPPQGPFEGRRTYDTPAYQQPSQPAPRPSNGPPVEDKDAKDRMIYITGIVGRAMGSGKFDPPDIRELTRFASEVYAEFFR